MTMAQYMSQDERLSELKIRLQQLSQKADEGIFDDEVSALVHRTFDLFDRIDTALSSQGNLPYDWRYSNNPYA